MCIRYDFNSDQLVKWSQAIGAWVPLDDWLAGRDIFVGYVAPMVVLQDRRKQLTVGNWGLIPPGCEDPNFVAKWHTYNARSEGNDYNNGIENAKTFREAIRKRRCIIPASGYYEQEDNYWHRLTVDSQEVMGIAGIWELPVLTPHPTFSMVTTPPNAVVEKVQDRMPLVLHPRNFDTWLDPKTPMTTLKSLMVPYPAEDFRLEQREVVSLKKEIAKSQGNLFDEQ